MMAKTPTQRRDPPPRPPQQAFYLAQTGSQPVAGRNNALADPLEHHLLFKAMEGPRDPFCNPTDHALALISRIGRAFQEAACAELAFFPLRQRREHLHRGRGQAGRPIHHGGIEMIGLPRQPVYRPHHAPVGDIFQPEPLERRRVQSAPPRQPLRYRVGAFPQLVQDRRRAEELIAAKDGVTAQMQQRPAPETQPAGQKHQPDLAGRGKNQRALDVGLRQPGHEAVQRTRQPEQRHDRHQRRRLLEQRLQPQHQINPGMDHHRAVEQRAGWGRPFHGPRQPRRERHLRRFGDRRQQEATG
jgi:hypothetical protein